MALIPAIVGLRGKPSFNIADPDGWHMWIQICTNTICPMQPMYAIHYHCLVIDGYYWKRRRLVNRATTIDLAPH
jgi:hypothetical protein